MSATSWGDVVAPQFTERGTGRLGADHVILPLVERGVADRAPQLLEALPVMFLRKVVERLPGRLRSDELLRIVQRVGELVPVVQRGQHGQVVRPAVWSNQFQLLPSPGAQAWNWSSRSTMSPTDILRSLRM